MKYQALFCGVVSGKKKCFTNSVHADETVCNKPITQFDLRFLNCFHVLLDWLQSFLHLFFLSLLVAVANFVSLIPFHSFITETSGKLWPSQCYNYDVQMYLIFPLRDISDEIL